MLLLMRTTGLVEIVNITGLSLCRNLQMLSACRVCALESSSFIILYMERLKPCILKWANVWYTLHDRLKQRGESALEIVASKVHKVEDIVHDIVA